MAVAAVWTPLAAPVIARARLRAGNTTSATGAGRLLAQALTTARAAGVTARILCRAEWAYYGHAFVSTALRHDAPRGRAGQTGGPLTPHHTHQPR